MNKIQERINLLEEEISRCSIGGLGRAELKGIKFAQQEILKMIDKLQTYAPLTSEIMEKSNSYGEWIDKKELKKQIKGEK